MVESLSDVQLETLKELTKHGYRLFVITTDKTRYALLPDFYTITMIYDAISDNSIEEFYVPKNTAESLIEKGLVSKDNGFPKSPIYDAAYQISRKGKEQKR